MPSNNNTLMIVPRNYDSYNPSILRISFISIPDVTKYEQLRLIIDTDRDYKLTDPCPNNKIYFSGVPLFKCICPDD